jgi:pimeloyl-ACP methyl ester carboxylesterase
LVDRYFELNIRDGNREALGKRFIDTKAGPLADRMGKLTQPVFIMWGEQDGFILINIGQRFHRELAHSEFISFSDLGHVPQEEEPRVTVDAAKRFCIANKCNSFR